MAAPAGDPNRPSRRWKFLQRPHSRAGSVVLTGTMLLGVLGAALGVGYTASRPLMYGGGAHVAKGDTVAYVNAESRRVEAEARALALGHSPVEVVTLADGRLAVVDHGRNQVQLVEPAQMQAQGQPIDRPDSTPPANADDPASRPRRLAVVPAPDSGYLVDVQQGTVEQIDLTRSAAPAQVPGGLTEDAVPDGTEGIWVRTRDGRVARAAHDRVELREVPDRIQHLTVADGMPIGITDSGYVLDLTTDPIRRITGEQVSHGDHVVVGSAKGAGRWIVIVDRGEGQLVVIDPSTGSRRGPYALPRGPRHNLGAPVQVRDRIYIPDFGTRSLYEYDVLTGRLLREVSVPGESGTFALEVRDGQVWINDQFDRRVRVIDPQGQSILVDKGTGHGITSDTSNEPQDGQQTQQPQQDQPPQNQQQVPTSSVPRSPAYRAPATEDDDTQDDDTQDDSAAAADPAAEQATGACDRDGRSAWHQEKRGWPASGSGWSDSRSDRSRGCR